jgi:hypothetical protein
MGGGYIKSGMFRSTSQKVPIGYERELIIAMLFLKSTHAPYDKLLNTFPHSGRRT